MNSRQRTWSVIIAYGLYVMAFLLPVTNPYADDNSGGLNGADAFYVGWTALTAVGPWDLDNASLAAAWLANPAFWLALGGAVLDRGRASALAAGVGVALALPVLPRYAAVVGGQQGYWLWLASLAVLAAAPAATLLTRQHSESGRPAGTPLPTSQAIRSLRPPGG
jgi:hypothetical protein